MENKLITLPETRQERVVRLSDTIKILKSEFVGLDSIIDEIKESISAWYITPEIINRPVVISLWGMTGTGKSSLVRRLIELLGLVNSQINFDCGECTNDNTNIGGSICEAFGAENDDESILLGGSNEKDPFKRTNYVFVFDEFQYARTLNEEGNEEIKSGLRPIWSIIDNGIVELTDRYSWEFNRFASFVEDIESVAEIKPGIKIKENYVNDPDEVKFILENIGLLQYEGRDIPGVQTGRRRDEDDEDPYKPLQILENEKLRYLIKRLNGIKTGLGLNIAKELLNSECDIAEFSKMLRTVYRSIIKPKSIDCSNALVFVIGNLDEAYNVAKDMNPDIDADMFYDTTSKVTISDIKQALTSRFRAEQIARLGNNLIKYPTLKKSDFKKIIKLETTRVINEFKKICNIDVEINENTYDLLYSEGVFPTQGVRPVLTTIGSIFTPYFSKILIENDGSEKVMIEVPTNNFKTPTIEIKIKFSSGKTITYEQKLRLGEIRDPKQRKKRYIASVHEAGHAIVYASCTGNAPDSIVSVSTDKGGFCTTYDKEMEGEIKSKIDVKNEVMISLGGYLAEELIFDKDLCLLGSSSDLASAWEELSENAYSIGYLHPRVFSNRLTESGNIVPRGFDDKEISKELDNLYENFKREAADIINDEKKLIIEMAKYLGETGSMSSEKFLEMVEKYGNTLTLNYMKEVKEKLNPEYYFNKLNR